MRRTTTWPIGLALPFLSAPLFLLVVAPLTGCDRGPRAADSSRADAEFTPPPPAAAETSRFSVPLDYDFGAILRVVERVVPKTFGSIDSVRQAGDDTHRHYAFQADRGPFTAFADGRLVHLQATLDYQVRGWFKPIIGPTIGAGCGKDPAHRPRLVIEMATPLTLTDNWHLASHAQIVRVEPASTLPQDHCDVSLLHKDITPRVVEAARLGIIDHLPDIDKKVAEVNLRNRFVEWWGLLRETDSSDRRRVALARSEPARDGTRARERPYPSRAGHAGRVATHHDLRRHADRRAHRPPAARARYDGERLSHFDGRRRRLRRGDEGRRGARSRDGRSRRAAAPSASTPRS